MMISLPDYTPATLMHHAEEEYKRLIMEDKWDAAGKEEKLIALKTEIGNLFKGNNNSRGKGKGKGKGKGGEKGKRNYQRLSDEEMRKPPSADKTHEPR
jgi:hypothetical protein